jgi:ankyrin repeat protein
MMGNECGPALLYITFSAGCLVAAGCEKPRPILAATWHQTCGWKAADYFDDPQVIALCKAIEANDLKEIDRLVAAGADVNAKGKGNMTPLLWAFPDNKLPRFKRLLEHGADPNVILSEHDFNARGEMKAGKSVTHMASTTSFPGYFEAVFEHGGDVNLVETGKGL